MAVYFTGIKNKSVIVSATVSVHAYFESEENTPNMDIKIFFYLKNLFREFG